jgi:nuclear receptor co-repressor 1
MPPQQQQAPSSQPAHKKIRLGESPYQPQTNSLHHPAATPNSIPVRLHHTNYDKAGPPIQSSNSHVVVHVASTPRTHQNPIVGATADIQYQPQKPPSQPPTHQIPTAASPQAPQTQPQQQQSTQNQQQQQQQQQQPPSNTNTKVLSVLKIDTRDPPPPNSNSNSNNNNNNSNNNANNNLGGGYHPKTEAISPAGSPKLSKDDLLQQISSVDSSMMSLEERKKLLKEKERMLIEQKEEGVEDVPEQPTPHRTLAQQIYAENKKKASDSHAILTAFNFKGQTFELPLYNQPSDADVCRKIHEQYLTFRSSLLLHLRKIKSERAQRSQELSDQYAKLSAEWQKRVEKIESSMKRKNRELKNRELFEKVFVELRKQREDKERFNRVGSRVKSEADFEVIVDGLQEQVRIKLYINPF